MHYVAAVKRIRGDKLYRKSSSQLHFKTYAFSSRLLFSNTSWSSLLALEVRQSSVRVEMYLWQALLCRHSEIMGNTQLYSNENKLASLRVLNKFSKQKPLINWALNLRKLSKKTETSRYWRKTRACPAFICFSFGHYRVFSTEPN